MSYQRQLIMKCFSFHEYELSVTVISANFFPTNAQTPTLCLSHRLLKAERPVPASVACVTFTSLGHLAAGKYYESSVTQWQCLPIKCQRTNVITKNNPEILPFCQIKKKNVTFNTFLQARFYRPTVCEIPELPECTWQLPTVNRPVPHVAAPHKQLLL